MAQYGAAVTWLIILFVILVTGVIYMMLTPLIEMFVTIGLNAGPGADNTTIQVIETAIKVWLPIVIILSLVMYGWRKSKNRIE